jgi:hypothetical protein
MYQEEYQYQKPAFTLIYIYLLFDDFINLHTFFLFTSSHRFGELHCSSAIFDDPRVPCEYLLAVTSGRITVVRTKVLVSSSLSINMSNRLARFGYRFWVLALCVYRSTFASTNTISEPTVCLTQTMHQSCIKSSTISKRTEPSFHLSHVNKESHRVRPKRFLCLWYVRCEPCTCLALTLTLSPNGLKQDSTRPMSLTSPSGASQTICEPMVRSVPTVHLSCVKISTISKRTEQSSTRPTSLRSTIGCV